MSGLDDPLTEKIIGAAIEVHRELGPGLLESAYQKSMEIELRRCGLNFVAQLDVPVAYKGEPLDVGYKLDLLVEGLVVVELKAVEKLMPVHKAQLITYLKLCKISKGLLINFNQAYLTDGLRRAVLTF